MKRLPTSPVLLLAILFVSLLLLIGCSSGGGAPTTSQGDEGPATGDESLAGDDQQQSMEELEQLAKQEGTVTWYTVVSIEAANAVAAAFTAETGINVEIYRQTGGPLTETFYAEAARNDYKADVMTHSESAVMLRMANEGLLAHYVPQAVDQMPQEVVERGQGYVYPTTLSIMTISYNEDLVTGEDLEFLRSDPYAAIVDPRFKGQVTLPDPNVNGSSFNHLYMVGLSKGGWDSPEAKAWYEALAANEPLFFNSNGPVADAIVSGEARVAMIVESFAAPLVKAGAPMAIIYPKPTFADVTASGVIEKAPHPNAARYFFEWLMSKTGQEQLNIAYDASVPNREAAEHRTYLTEKDWYQPFEELFFVPDLEQQDQDRTPFFEYFNELFGL